MRLINKMERLYCADRWQKENTIAMKENNGSKQVEDITEINWDR